MVSTKKKRRGTRTEASSAPAARRSGESGETDRSADNRSQLPSETDIRQPNTELKQRVANRTATLAESEHRIRAILDAAVDAIVTIDTSGTIETFNAVAEKMFGYTAAEAVGRNVAILMGTPYRGQHGRYLERYLETRETHLIGRLREFRARRKDGTEFPIQLSVTEIADLGLFMGIIRDATEQRELQEEIVRLATAEQRRIGEELHDSIQQELTGLALKARNLADKLSASPSPTEHELAADIAAGITETHRHVRDLAHGLVPVAVDAEGLMRALDRLARSMNGQNGISCRFFCPKPVRIPDDQVALHLYRIAQEGVTNAIKHAEADEITIDLEYTGGDLQLEIRDNGLGIDTSSHDHNGLGLRIMEHRCGLMGGTFSVCRRDAGGTAVSCRVPMPGGG